MIIKRFTKKYYINMMTFCIGAKNISEAKNIKQATHTLIFVIRKTFDYLFLFLIRFNIKSIHISYRGGK